MEEDAALISAHSSQPVPCVDQMLDLAMWRNSAPAELGTVPQTSSFQEFSAEMFKDHAMWPITAMLLKLPAHSTRSQQLNAENHLIPVMLLKTAME